MQCQFTVTKDGLSRDSYATLYGTSTLVNKMMEMERGKFAHSNSHYLESQLRLGIMRD
jgi:hypothetical protein